MPDPQSTTALEQAIVAKRRKGAVRTKGGFVPGPGHAGARGQSPRRRMQRARIGGVIGGIGGGGAVGQGDILRGA